MSYSNTVRAYSFQLGDGSFSAAFPSNIERTSETDALALAVVNAYIDLMRALQSDTYSGLQFSEVTVTNDSQSLA